MPLLNFEPSGPERNGSRSPFKLLLGIGTLVGTIALGSTLAASINLNDGGPVEFGQGVTQTTACDSDVVVTPTSSFVNADGGGGFKFSAITLVDLDGTEQTDASDEGCAGKTFTIKTYDSYGAQLQPAYEISVDSEGIFSSLDGDVDGTEEGNTESSVTLSFDEELISAESVYRITIESEDSVEVTTPGYEVGDPGPGGGIIFYVSEDGFNCGPTFELTCEYLEVAPGDWNGVTGDANGSAWAITSLKSTDVIGITDEGTSRDGTGIGLGYKNSLAVMEQGNDETVAASVALSYASTSRDDWYLPTSVELNLLCQWNRGVLSSSTTGCEGGSLNSEIFGAQTSNLTDWYYWSSSEYGGGTAWLGGMRSSNNRAPGAKDATAWRVRPIRAF